MLSSILKIPLKVLDKAESYAGSKNKFLMSSAVAVSCLGAYFLYLAYNKNNNNNSNNNNNNKYENGVGLFNFSNIQSKLINDNDNEDNSNNQTVNQEENESENKENRKPEKKRVKFNTPRISIPNSPLSNSHN